MELNEERDELLAGTSDVQAAHDAEMERKMSSYEMIELRAYEIWLQRGGGDGDSLGDWLQAEAEVNAALGTGDQDKFEDPDEQIHRTAYSG